MKNIKLSVIEAIGAIIMGSLGVIAFYTNYVDAAIVLISVATVWAVHAHFSWKVKD